jgi:hypothetical protein
MVFFYYVALPFKFLRERQLFFRERHQIVTSPRFLFSQLDMWIIEGKKNFKK